MLGTFVSNFDIKILPVCFYRLINLGIGKGFIWLKESGKGCSAAF